MPVRIQRQRKLGWRKPPGAINCTRPGKYGNPYHGAFYQPEESVEAFRDMIKRMKRDRPQEFEAYIAPLRGKDLMCWCDVSLWCHVDVLLEFANGR